MMKQLKRIFREDSWVRPFLKQYRNVLILSLTLGVLTMVFAAALMFVAGYLISDAAEMPTLGLYSLLVPLGLVQVFGIGKPFLAYYERLTSHDWVLRVTSSLRKKLYETIEAKGVRFSAHQRIGDTLGLLASDLTHVQNLYLKTIFPLMLAWVLLALIVLFAGAFSLLFALCMLLGLFVLAVLVPLVSLLLNAALQQHAKALTSELYTRSYDDVAGLADWTFSGRREDFVARVMRTDANLGNAYNQLAKRSRALMCAVEVFFGMLSLVVLVWAVWHFAGMAQAAAATGVAGRPADWIAAFVIGFFPLLEAFAALPDAASQLSEHADSLVRLNELSAPGVEHAKAALAGEVSAAATSVAAPAALATDALVATNESVDPAEQGKLLLENVSFAFDAGEQLINNVSISIQRGEKLALLGPSGSGKSTLLSLIRGDIVPDEGRIFVNGKPVSAWGANIHQQLAVVQQNTYLFNQSLYGNLCLGDASISREAAYDALVAVGLKALVERLPYGLDTLVDEAGLRFSGGERHRIALARVLLRPAPIVLLDEPTVSLDPLTERALLKTMFEVLSDRSIVLVTHHLAGVEYMDRVMFLEHGNIALQGSPQELERENARYRKLLDFDWKL